MYIWVIDHKWVINPKKKQKLYLKDCWHDQMTALYTGT